MQKRPLFRPHIFFPFVLAIFLLSACTGNAQNQSWPGLSVEGNTVYVSYGPGIIAYDVEQEAQKWSYPEEANGSLQFFAPPSVQNGRIIIGDYGVSGGFLNPAPIISIYALQDNSNSVDELWIRDQLAKDRIVAKPLQVDNVVYVGTADNILLALEADTGEQLWQFSSGHSIWAQPTLVDDTLYVASLDHNLYALDPVTGEEKWHSTTNGALSGKPIVENGLILLSNFDNRLIALDAETGETAWTAESTDWIWSAPTVSDGVVYFGDSNGTVFAVSLETGNEIWRESVKGAIQTSPVVANGIVYVASEGDIETERGSIVALDAKTGSVIWDEETPAPIFTTPVVVGDKIVVAMIGESSLLIGFNLETGNIEFDFNPEST